MQQDKLSTSLQTAFDSIITAGRLIEPALDRARNNPAVEDCYQQWLSRHGLQASKESLATIARQTIYFQILNRILIETPTGVSIEDVELRHLLDVVSLDTSSLIDDITQQIEQARPDAEELGRIYETIVAPEERRRLGHFQTPAAIVDLMVRWAVRNATDTVLDPGVGAGVFLAAAHDRLRRLGARPVRVLTQLCGIDVNPIAVTMASLALALKESDNRSSDGRQLNIELADFIVGSTPICGHKQFDAIVCNPPYSRHHELVNGYKEKAGQVAEEVLGQPLSRLASLYIHFFVRALALLADGGRLAFITPREYLEVDYARPLRQHLLQNYCVKAIILFDEASLIFPGVLTSACISLVEQSNGAGNAVRLIEATATATTDDLLAAADGVGGPAVRISEIPQTHLSAKEKWTRHLHAQRRSIFTGLPETELGQLLTVKRGIATGHNSFFCLTENDVARWNLPNECLQPVVTGARDLPACIFGIDDIAMLRKASRPVWLFYWPLDWTIEDAPESVRRYLAYGEQINVPERYICKNRNLWYVGERRAPADVLFTLFNRGNPRFVLNEARVLIVNVLHGLSVTLSLSGETQRLKALLAWLNSNAGREGLRQAGRVYGGMLKAEPGELSRMRVPDVLRLDMMDVNELAMLFDKLCLAQRQQGDVVMARQAIENTYRKLAH